MPLLRYDAALRRRRLCCYAVAAAAGAQHASVTLLRVADVLARYYRLKAHEDGGARHAATLPLTPLHFRAALLLRVIAT